MESTEENRAGKIIAVIGAVAMVLFSYMIVCFFRLEWVRYDTVERSWQVETMHCENQEPIPVIHLYMKPDAQPDIPIRYSSAMFEHLNQQSQNDLPVKRKLIGYLREWDYGTIILQSIAGRYVDKRTIIFEHQYQDCEYKKSDNVKKTSVDTRRKMR